MPWTKPYLTVGLLFLCAVEIVTGLSCAPRGAQLPISYSISSLPGTVRYISNNGSDSSGDGSINKPYATLSRAYQASQNGDSIVIRGGRYPFVPGLYIAKRLTFIAYPGEIPTFDGSIPAPTTVSSEGNLRYFTYQPVPARTGLGVSLANLEQATFNSTGPTGKALVRGWRCVSGSNYYKPNPTPTDVDGCGSDRPTLISGYYPDQVWVDDVALIQVLDKSLVTPGTFWLERTQATDNSPPSTSLYMHMNDAVDMSKVRVSSTTGLGMTLATSGIRIEGIRIINHSPTWAHMAVHIANVSNIVLRNVEFDSMATISLNVGGEPYLEYLARNITLDQITVRRSGWQAMSFVYTDDVTLKNSILTDTDPHAQFYSSPSTGTMKATKNHRFRIENCEFNGGVSQQVWFDQSNYDISVADSDFFNAPIAIFFEISHKLTLVNNFIHCHHPSTIKNNPCIKTAGSSGIRVVGNTIIGGEEIVSVLIDSRSKDYGTPSRSCAEHTVRYRQGGDAKADCNVDYSSDFDLARPGAYGTGPNLTPGMNWKPQLEMLINNILVNSSGFTYCGVATVICVTATYNSGGINIVIPTNFVVPPNATIEGNIYSSPSTNVARVSGSSNSFIASNLGAFKGSSGLGSSWYGLTIETMGVEGTGFVNIDGSPTPALAAIQGNAFPIPNDPVINMYLEAGSTNYGRTRLCGSLTPTSQDLTPEPVPVPTKSANPPPTPVPTPIAKGGDPPPTPSFIPGMAPSPSPSFADEPTSYNAPSPATGGVPPPTPIEVPSLEQVVPSALNPAIPPVEPPVVSPVLGTPVVPPVVHCQVSPWSNFGPCSVSCGGGTYSRSRSVTVYASGGGDPCPPLFDTALCNDIPCPSPSVSIDCVMTEWSDWTPCTCPNVCTGSQGRSRNVLVTPLNGGQECPSNAFEERPCTCSGCLQDSPATVPNQSPNEEVSGQKRSVIALPVILLALTGAVLL